MQTKPLLYGIIGFLLGGLIVSIAVTTFEKPKENGMSMSGMVNSLEGKTGDDFDKSFIDGMIAHHLGAIDMARMAERQAKHQEIKDLSKAVISAQQKEVDEMRQWQSNWGYTDTTQSHERAH